MRFLHCISTLDPAGGGPREALRLRLLALTALGHESEVACLDAKNAPWLAGQFPALVHALGPPRWGNYRYSSQWRPWVQANHSRFDAVIINGLWQYNGFGTRRALPQGFPYFVFPHGMLDPWFKRHYPFKHLKKWLYWPWADYRMLRDARAVCFTSEQERLLARESFWLYRCNQVVVNYGTAGPTGDVGQQQARLAERFPHLRGKRCLLFLGRVHEKKGPGLLFQAFAEVLARLPPETTQGVHLVLAGPNDHAYGRQMADLAVRLGLQDRVTWTGMIEGDLKWGAFHAAEAFILPSHQENFGIAVAEALACGVPVLISDQVNIWREIAEDRAGFVASDDIPGTASLITRWLETPPAEWLAMKKRAKQCYQSRFTIEQAALSLVRAAEKFGGRGRA